MIFARYSLALLGLIALQTLARANSFKLASDMQTCIKLCDNCGGTADFEDSVCQCHVADDDQKGAECIGRIKRQADELGLDVVSCDPANTEADRTTRCIFSPRRRFKNREDADLIAKYFMDNPLGDLKSLLGSKSEKKEDATDSDSEKENEEKREVSEGGSSDSNSQIVGAANPMPLGQFADYSPLLGLPPTWSRPQALMALGNGYPGMGSNSGSSSFVGAQNPNFEQTNYVGSSQPKSWDLYSNYPPGSMPGISPYTYFVGAPYPVQYAGGSPGSPYSYGYDPSLVGSNDMGSSPYSPLPVEKSDSQLGDRAPLPDGSLDESAKSADELVKGIDDPDPNSGAKRDAFEDGVGSSKSIKEENKEEEEEEEVEEAASYNKRTANDMEADADVVAAPMEEIKEPSLSRSKSKMKRRQYKITSKANLKQQ